METAATPLAPKPGARVHSELVIYLYSHVRVCNEFAYVRNKPLVLFTSFPATVTYNISELVTYRT